MNHSDCLLSLLLLNWHLICCKDRSDNGGASDASRP
jgi:hypothetical protein